MEPAGKTLRQSGQLRALCVAGLLLLCIGALQDSAGQTVPADTQQTRPPSVDRVRGRIQELRQTPNEWRRRLGAQLSPDASATPRQAVSSRRERPPSRSASRATGVTQADLRRLERRLQSVIEEILLEDYGRSLPVRPREWAERFRYVPPDTVRIAPPVRDTVMVPGAERVVRDTVRRVQQVERQLLDTGVFRAFEVNFSFGRSTLQSRATRTLDAVGDVLRRYPELRIEVAGHTDSIGSEAFNQRLSEARAEAVRTYLLDRFDLASNRIAARGYGETRPIAANSERAGRALNRRVEFEVLNRDAVPLTPR